MLTLSNLSVRWLWKLRVEGIVCQGGPSSALLRRHGGHSPRVVNARLQPLRIRASGRVCGSASRLSRSAPLLHPVKLSYLLIPASRCLYLLLSFAIVVVGTGCQSLYLLDEHGRRVLPSLAGERRHWPLPGPVVYYQDVILEILSLRSIRLRCSLDVLVYLFLHFFLSIRSFRLEQLAGLSRIDSIRLRLFRVPTHALEQLHVLGLVKGGKRALTMARESEALRKHVHVNPGGLLEPG